jgi:pimeloyl-ACP methyl ester carboxylesterase
VIPRLLPALGALLLACAGLRASVVATAMDRERGKSGLVRRELQVGPDRIALLERAGERPVLLVHGFAADKDNWTLFAQHLPKAWRLIAPDLPGFGESPFRAQARYDVAAQAERLHGLLEQLGAGPVHAVANSMGGHVAAALALLHPEDVRSLSLFNAAGVEQPRPTATALAIARGENPLVVGDEAGYQRLMGLVFVHPPELPGFVTRHFLEEAVRGRPRFERIFADLQAAPMPLDGRLGEIRVPALILWGASDQLIDVSAASTFAAGLKRSRTVLLEDCGHAPMLERPQESAAHLVAFLDAVEAGAFGR